MTIGIFIDISAIWEGLRQGQEALEGRGPGQEGAVGQRTSWRTGDYRPRASWRVLGQTKRQLEGR